MLRCLFLLLSGLFPQLSGLILHWLSLLLHDHIYIITWWFIEFIDDVLSLLSDLFSVIDQFSLWSDFFLIVWIWYLIRFILIFSVNAALCNDTSVVYLFFFVDTSGGDQVTDFRSCKTFLRGVQGTTYTNLCVCDTSNCNKGHNLKSSWLVSLMVGVILAFLSVR